VTKEITGQFDAFGLLQTTGREIGYITPWILKPSFTENGEAFAHHVKYGTLLNPAATRIGG
jgi:hypothetical protein